MIDISNISNIGPYQLFIEKAEKALENSQKSMDAIVIGSYNQLTKEVDSRYVNLKYIIDNEWIFFTNYNSQKAVSFETHNQISALIYWNSIDVQIRIKAKIKKTSKEFNQKYFMNRVKEKNALAISSNQSKQIDSYSQVIENYNKTLKKYDLKKCPEYWGGFSFIPYYFEFWVGHESRINKREVFDMTDGVWSHSFLQP
jgi:pyridoxamine 5'-phosphate oxidase